MDIKAEQVTVECVRQDVKLATARLESKRPFHKSQWRKALHDFFGASAHIFGSSGEFTRSTFMTGGVIQCSRAVYRAALEQKADDCLKGVVMTDSEMSPEVSRAFFELDYRDPQFLPEPRIVRDHLRTALGCVHKAFPRVNPLRMAVSVCDLKTKLKAGQDLLCLGVHLVFPDLVVKPALLMRLSAFVDREITASTPEWGGVVDQSSYKTNYTNLRPNGSYKTVKCSACEARSKFSVQPGRRAPAGESGFGRTMESKVGVEGLVCPPGCYGGMVVEPSVYRLSDVLTCTDGKVQHGFDTMSMHDELLLTSINPPDSVDLTPGFTDHPDIPQALDLVLTTLRNQNSVAQPLNFRQHHDVLTTLWAIVRDFFPAYAQAQVHTMKITDRSVVFITLKSHGSKFCICAGEEHSNGVFFTVHLKRGTVNFHCYDRVCKQEISATNKAVQNLKSAKYHASKLIKPHVGAWNCSGLSGSTTFPLGSSLVGSVHHAPPLTNACKVECFSHKIPPKTLTRLVAKIARSLSPCSVPPEQVRVESTDATSNHSSKTSALMTALAAKAKMQTKDESPALKRAKH